MVGRAPLYQWQIDIEKEKNKSKKDFIDNYADEIGLGKKYISNSEIDKLLEIYDISKQQLESIVNEYNTKFVSELEKKYFDEFKDFLKSHDQYIDIKEKSEIKKKYSLEYCDIYKDFSFERLIDEFNRPFIEEFKNKIKLEFKELIKSQGSFIDNKTKNKLISKFNKKYPNCLDKYELNEMIDEFNQSFIEIEKENIKKEINDILDKRRIYFDNYSIYEIKSKYNKDYFNFYEELNIEKEIEDFNENFIKNEKNLFKKEFIDYLNTKGIIDDYNKIKIKEKYNKKYCNYYQELEFENLIDKHNNDIIKNQKMEILRKDLGFDFEKYISNSYKRKIKDNSTINFNLDEFIEWYNEQYIEKHFNTDKEFFENIAGRSLDNHQIRAVLTDEDNTQIVAGAGTGKTLTIQAKIKYLIEKQGIAPNDILCLSYSRSSAADLENKINKTIDEYIEVRTFHSLGYSILGMNYDERKVPDESLDNLIDDFFIDYITNDNKLIKKIIEFFAYYYNIIHINQDDLNLQTLKSRINDLDEFDEYFMKFLQIEYIDDEKEYVGSIIELIIANFLFIHNIKYETQGSAKYKYQEYDKWIKRYHQYLFAMENENIPYDIKQEFIQEFDLEFGHEPSNDVYNFFLLEFDTYLNIGSVKDIDKKFKTKLLSIKEDFEDIDELLKTLENLLEKNNIPVEEKDYNTLYELFIINKKLPEYRSFIKTIVSFINLFKGNGENIDENGNDISQSKFKKYIHENNNSQNIFTKRNQFFLEIISKIYEIYSKYLEDTNLLDYDDMINDAIIELKNRANVHDYKYILVDEYQDTSHTRYKLLKEVQNRTNAKVIVVGDDWQSIFGFTGCDVNLFAHFEDYFENPKRVKIEITHRNSQQLIDVVGKFILKNKNQIPKELKSDIVTHEKPIKLVEYMSRSHQVLSFFKVLDMISAEKSDAEVLIIGRNNRDIRQILCKEFIESYEYDDYIEIKYTNNPDLNIKFRTVHKSKGLESDYAIILNLNNHLIGFPNKMENDSVLKYVNHQKYEGIDYPEERRLFYVALTRTRKDVYVFHKDLKYSMFISEIKNEKQVENLSFVFENEEHMHINSLLESKFEVIETNNICPNCGIGSVNLIVNNDKGTSYFKCSKFCGWDGGSHHNDNYAYENKRYLDYVKYAEVCDCGGMMIVKQNSYTGGFFLGCNFYKTRKCRGKSLPLSIENEIINDFRKRSTRNSKGFDKNKDSLKISDRNVYYIYDYISNKNISNSDSDLLQMRERILEYKNHDFDQVELFTKDLMDAILYLEDNIIHNDVKDIYMIPVPCSKVDKQNVVKKSINIIERWVNQEKSNSKQNLINYNELLKRKYDVKSSHLGNHLTKKEQIDSISCSKQLSNENSVYLLLDDITTTGTIMSACEEILINNGAKSDEIYKLVVGKTLWNKKD